MKSFTNNCNLVSIIKRRHSFACPSVQHSLIKTQQFITGKQFHPLKTHHQDQSKMPSGQYEEQEKRRLLQVSETTL